MRIQQITAPTIEPISLAELKLHLRLDSGSFADNVTTMESLAPGSHAVADDYTTHAGTGVSVIGKTAIVNLVSGTNGTDGTNDTKIQESDDNVTYTDWSSGAFTQVTESNDNAIQEKAYSGTKAYIRTASKVLVAACIFGTEIVTLDPTSIEDDLLTSFIQTAREHIEDVTRRALLTQTWDYYLDKFPIENFIKIPFGNLQDVTHIKYKDSDWASSADDVTLTEGTDYLVEINGEECGRIVLPYGETWPSFTAYPSNPIVIRFICGWTAAASVPEKIRTAVKMICNDIYSNRESQSVGQAQIYFENKTVARLLASARLWDEFE